MKGFLQVGDDFGSLERLSDEDGFELFLDSSDDENVDENCLNALQKGIQLVDQSLRGEWIRKNTVYECSKKAGRKVNRQTDGETLL